MKKIICLIILFIFLLVSCMNVYALDLSNYTDEDLSLLYEQLMDEMNERCIEKIAHLEAGKYIGGRDIPTGDYLIFVDNTNGADDIKIKYTCKSDLFQSGSGIISAGKTFRMYVTVYESDILLTDGKIDLILNPQVSVTFE